MQRNRSSRPHAMRPAFDPWMVFDLDEEEPDDEEVFFGVPTILWTGALRIAGGEAISPLPEALDALTEQYFRVFEPDVQA